MKTWLVALATGTATALAGLYWVGAYDISATDQHLAPTYWLLDTAMRRSIVQRAKAIAVPPLDDAAAIARGAVGFRRHCAQCHGAPGVAPEPFALGMTPVPANLAHTARTWRPAELFWTIKEGIKMTGMPAWAYRMDDGEIWAIVAFLGAMPALAPDEYRALVREAAARLEVPRTPTSGEAGRSTGDAQRGRRAVHQYACVTCHVIPGIVGSNSPVGPPLARIGTRAFIAGVLPNTPEAMIRWLRSPQSESPRSAMPDLGVTERDAADIAAFLATLK